MKREVDDEPLALVPVGADPDVVGMLERWLEDAKSGKLVAVVAAGVLRGNLMVTGSSIGAGAPRALLLFAMERARLRLILRNGCDDI